MTKTKEFVVPSDIAIAEYKSKTGERSLTLCEKLGLAVTPPLIRIGRAYKKLSNSDERTILSNDFTKMDDVQAKALLEARQRSVSKRVRSRLMGAVGTFAGLGFSIAFTTSYGPKVKALAAMPSLYLGMVTGRALGGILTGRVRENLETRMLLNEPAWKIMSN